MKAKLPLFPLGLVAFPEEKLNLHIFEPRYRQLVHECYDKNTTFGIPPVIKDKPIMLGTEMKIIEIAHTYPDGKMDIKTQGLRKFVIDKYHSRIGEKLYPGGDVEFIEDNTATDIVLVNRVIKLIGDLYEEMKMKLTIPTLNDSFRIHSIIHKIGLNMDQEVEVLGMHSEFERLEYAENHLTELLPVVREMEGLRKKVQMNGHFKNVIPPEINLDEF